MKKLINLVKIVNTMTTVVLALYGAYCLIDMYGFYSLRKSIRNK